MTRISLERPEPGDDLRQLFEWLDGEQAGGGPAECAPPLDVFETAATLEVIADLPGVGADEIRVVFSRNMVVIAGRKLPAGCEHHEAAFHLAERSFGRFARVVRLTGAFDAGQARATLHGGELHIVLPRLEERRGQQIRIPVATG